MNFFLFWSLVGELPLWACEFECRPCLGLDSPTFQFSLSSPVQPPLQFSYCLRERQLFVEEANAGPPLLEHHTARLEARSQVSQPDPRLRDMHLYGLW